MAAQMGMGDKLHIVNASVTMLRADAHVDHQHKLRVWQQAATLAGPSS